LRRGAALTVSVSRRGQRKRIQRRFQWNIKKDASEKRLF
jgi:hypothetical protein